jgi:SAM-dependent methyltransferase
MLPPQTAIIATDLSDSMLDFARETVNASSRVTWQQADGMALGFDDGAFDVVVCQFGLMFFPDKAAGLRELGRVIAPGGRLLLSTWDSRDVNRFAHVLSERVTAFFPQEPPQFMAVPWHLHDRVALHAMTLDAGFRHAEVEALPADAEGPSAADAARGFVRGNPLAMQLQDRGANMDAIEQSVADGLAELGGTSPLRFAMQALLLHAHR